MHREPTEHETTEHETTEHVRRHAASDVAASLVVPGCGQLAQSRFESGLRQLYVVVLLWTVFLGVVIGGHDPMPALLFPVLFHLWSAVDAGMRHPEQRIVRCRVRG